MNEFYDIAPEGQTPENDLQLPNLGKRKLVLMRSSQQGLDPGQMRQVSDEVFRDIAPGDYDQSFFKRVKNIESSWDVATFLDHHYKFYLQKHSEAPKAFLDHIKIKVLEKLEDKKENQLLIEAITRWIGDQLHRLSDPKP